MAIVSICLFLAGYGINSILVTFDYFFFILNVFVSISISTRLGAFLLTCSFIL